MGINADLIRGFDNPGTAIGDVIDLSAVSSGPLTFRGTAAFTGVNQVRLVNDGTNTQIEINLSGTTAPEMEINIEDLATTASAYRVQDFIL